MNPERLTLDMIDSHRHLTTSENIVSAVAFAVRLGHTDQTAYRFVSALGMLGSLDRRSEDAVAWPLVMSKVHRLVRENNRCPGYRLESPDLRLECVRDRGHGLGKRVSHCSCREVGAFTPDNQAEVYKTNGKAGT
jgi:hypothetical protein